MSELPAGTVTFLFTDLEGSTRLWEQHPEAMRPALEKHDDILRDAVEFQGGVIVKTTGDGLHAVFTTVLAAVEAALHAQRLLAGQRWPDEPGPLRVRMGIHSGDAIARDGDYYGPAVNRAARVMSAGHGGQVVLSLASAELVRDFLPDGVGLLDLGEHRLPDIARPERMFQLTASDLRADFPPLRTMDAMPGNLPRQLASFVGREREREAISEALVQARLVTVTGVAGVGKSRLALQVAADRASRYPDGAWLCDLTTVDDAEELAQLVADTLDVAPRPGVSVLAGVYDALHTRQLLLVLDNCDQLLDDVRDLVDGLVRECPHVHVIATTREALGLPGEQVWPLHALDVPIAGFTPTVDEVKVSTAAQLFEERARGVQPGFAIDAGNAAAVAEICRRLDGIPLALELAAARVTIMTPADIASRLDQRFNLLTAGRRSGASERHQTLRGAIEWSYEMLDPVERKLFERLGIFPGSFDSDAVATVAAAADLDPWDVLDAGAALVAKSMVVADDSTGTVRYHMLETIRTFARERLEEAGELETMMVRHAEHYTRFAEEAGLALLGADELAWRKRVRLEYDNLRAAYARCMILGLPETISLAIRIVAALAFEAVNDPGLRIGIWAAHLVDRLGDATPAQRTAVLSAAAFHAQEEGIDTRTEYAERALADGVPQGCAAALWAYITLAAGKVMTGDVEGGVAVIHEADAALRAAGNEPTSLSMLHSAAANFHNMAGDSAGARIEADLSLEAAKRSRNPTALASAQFAVAVALWSDDRTASGRALDEAIRMAQTGVGGGLLGYALARRAVLRADRADCAGAVRDITDALRRASDRGDRPMLTIVLECAMAVLESAGRPEATLVLAGSLENVRNNWAGRSLDFGMASDLGMVERVRRAAEAAGDDAVAVRKRGRGLDVDDAVAYALAELAGAAESAAA
ncbi:MAG: adenylate/guanylate cyclase domain-containing protein [Acidimicrobiia bacterium]